jgi:hypothetical protein
LSTLPACSAANCFVDNVLGDNAAFNGISDIYATSSVIYVSDGSNYRLRQLACPSAPYGISCAIISILMFKICSIQFRVGGMLAHDYIPSVSYPNLISFGCSAVTANFSAVNGFAFRESN